MEELIKEREEKISNFIFIKAFNDITIDSICKSLNINTGNVCTGKTSKENLRKVREVLEKKLTRLLLTGGKDV